MRAAEVIWRMRSVSEAFLVWVDRSVLISFLVMCL